MGAGRQPIAAPDHPRRPPLPIAPVDEAAARAVRERLTAAPGGLADLAAWLAAVSGDERPRGFGRIVLVAADHGIARADVTAVTGALANALSTVHPDTLVVDAGAGIDAAARIGIPPSRDIRTDAALSVAEVAAAVDAGRELAARAATAGVELVAGAACAPAAAIPATCLAAVLSDSDVGDTSGDDRAGEALARHPDAARGPLHALRRLGGGDIAALCGLALGAGEHGLGFVADGLPALAAATTAAAIEPGLRPRLAAASTGTPAEAALLAHLRLEPLLVSKAVAPGAGAVAALAMARLAALAG